MEYFLYLCIRLRQRGHTDCAKRNKAMRALTLPKTNFQLLSGTPLNM